MLNKTLRIVTIAVTAGFFANAAGAQESNAVSVPGNGALAITVPVVNSNTSSRDVFTVATGMMNNATLVNAIKASGLESGMRNRSSITILAPDNSAFEKLPPGLVEQLMKPENAAILNKIISYHILEGNHTTASIREAIKAGRGRAEFTTISGQKIVASIEENKIRITDDGNNACFITSADVKASNGIIHVLDKVAIPR